MQKRVPRSGGEKQGLNIKKKVSNISQHKLLKFLSFFSFPSFSSLGHHIFKAYAYNGSNNTNQSNNFTDKNNNNDSIRSKTEQHNSTPSVTTMRGDNQPFAMTTIIFKI